MDKRCGYRKALVLGSGKLAHQCALACRERLEKVEVLEYKVTGSTTLEKMCRRDCVPYACCDRALMRLKLEQEEERSLVVSAGNTFLIPADIIAREHLTIVNWHNALLPEHKGRNAESWSIYEGDALTGITWHMIAPEVDSGDIIVQREIPIDDRVTALGLYQRQCDAGLQAFREVLDPLLEGRCVLRKQRESGTAALHLSRDVPNGGELDLQWDFRRISCFLRAMDYGALRLLGDMRVWWEGIKYRFHKYEIRDTGSPEGFQGVAWQGQDLVLGREGHLIRLRNLRRDDGMDG